MPQPFIMRRTCLALSFMGLLSIAACNSSSGTDNEEPTPTPPPAPSIPDPLVGYQWYLKNTGQDVLAGVRPVAGVDLNVESVFESGIRGKGVVVAVLDDGVDGEHEDIADNVDKAGSINLGDCSNPADLNSCASTPLLNPSAPDDAHGTSIAGLIGMLALNGKGGRGIAPEARIKSFNLLADHGDGDDDEDESDSKADGFRYHLFVLGDTNQRAVDVDVFSMSYGGEDVVMPASDDVSNMQVYERVLASTRGGKGGVYLKAAGNEFLQSYSHSNVSCLLSHSYQVGCFDAATDAEASLSGIVLVAAANAAGKHSTYSSEGAPVWISGFGGEENIHPAYDTAASEADYEPALFTIDVSGCRAGYHHVNQRPINAIDNAGNSTIDPDCNYTASFNGTSGATPIVSAVSALILQARPELKARDVHYILAKSARHPGNWSLSGALEQPTRQTTQGRIFDQGWHSNAKGIRFSRWFGYGLVDAQAAVEMAKSFELLPPSRIADAQSAAGTSVAIRQANDQQVASHESSLALNINEDIAVERVQISFTTTHTRPSRLLVTLQSPSGTRIPALIPYTSLANTANGFEVNLLSVNGFLDEAARGEWRLFVEDMSQSYGADNDTPSAELPQLDAFSIRIIGHESVAR
ncbi:S8 family serine peptidase [Pusillimonas sp. CC-YST705]|uniref:S8 family serine peptidase n=1 Tax=Mesopusillimonas faecipullorum TaxID=2755040 RepID=A0ABS8CA26_9BURK|nr:S8 family serine peptidase [Mesopusillimonas faecipullorum]MCB5362890.1 S8 family serine peptidase [Mesopusillimonas faecipullorum]